MKSKKLEIPETPFRNARRIYFDSLLRMGFTLLRLYKLNVDGQCTCSPLSPTRNLSNARREEYKRTGLLAPCGNPGKHLVGNASQAMFRDVKKIEKHLDHGGSVGICMRMKRLPPMPLRLVVVDCDRPGALPWLERRGVRSPLEVPGRRGKHLYFLLPDDVPDLLSDTSSLNPGSKNPVSEEQPGIDIKVSGLVVTPYSPNKRLFLDGEDISDCPGKVQACFGTKETLEGLLPRLDPRILVPTMRVYAPGSEMIVSKESAGTDSEQKAEPRQKLDPRSTLSSRRSGRIFGAGDLRELPYHYRRNLAKNFLGRARVAVEGKNPDSTMFRVICSITKHYWMSELDSFDLVKRFYNHRCLDADGFLYPYGDRQLVAMIRAAQKAEVYDPIGRKNKEGWSPPCLERILKRIRKRDARSNLRRQKRANEQTRLIRNGVEEFLLSIGGDATRTETSAGFSHLHKSCNTWMKDHLGVTITAKRLGDILCAFGYRRVRRGKSRCLEILGIPLDAERNAA